MPQRYDDDPHNDIDEPIYRRIKMWWVFAAIAVAIVAWLVVVAVGLKPAPPAAAAGAANAAPCVARPCAPCPIKTEPYPGEH